MKKVIYIAGPYRGKTAWEIEENVRKAEKVALEIWRRGGIPLCPHTASRFFYGSLDEDKVLEGCLELLRRSDAVYFLPGWEGSLGASVEWHEAIGRRIPTYFSLDALLGTGRDQPPTGEPGA